MACLFGHKWKLAKCKKCGVAFGSVANEYIKAKNGKKLYELLSTAVKEDNYSIVTTWQPLALAFFLESGQDWFENSLELLYENADKNTFAFLLGRTRSTRAAAFLTEKLNSTHLGSFYRGHGVAMHDLAAPAAYATVRGECKKYSLDNAAPFYYALGAYKKPEDVARIADFIKRFIVHGKHSWGFSDSLRYAVAGMTEIGGQAAFDELLEIESSLRADPQSKKNLYEHRAVVLYGLLLISRGSVPMTSRFLDVLTLDVGNDIYNSYQQYILAQVSGMEQRVTQYALSRLNTLMEGECNRYWGTDCEAIYCLYALGRNGWRDYASIKPRFEAWLLQEDRFMIPYVEKYFVMPEDAATQKELLSHSTLQQFIRIESNIHNLAVAHLPTLDKKLGIQILPQ